MGSERVIDFVALSGLPRTGSTLLSAILSENPTVHAENHSAVCQLMWDMEKSFETDFCRVNLLGSNRTTTQHDLISSIPNIYYKDRIGNKVVDKCRSWTLPLNVELIKKYIRPDPKIIVMTRDVTEIIQSFIDVYEKNGTELDVNALMIPDTEPLTRPLAGVEYAQKNNNGEYLFVDYEDLVFDTQNVINAIYAFCGWDLFSHDLGNVVDRFPTNDSAWGVKELHKVRPTISKRYILC